MRLILASQSPSRKRLLEGAGLSPEIMVSNVDEETEYFNSMSPKDMVIALAITKAHTVLERLDANSEALIIACDSTFEFEGQSFGKPGSPDVAIERARRLSGRSGFLHTGHCIIDTKQGRELADLVTTRVTFDALDDSLIKDYVSTGEPMKVAGGFTLDGFSSPLIKSIDGDYTNVVGISMSFLRKSCEHLGYSWPEVKSMGSNSN
jgi:septum formation protein